MVKDENVKGETILKVVCYFIGFGFLISVFSSCMNVELSDTILQQQAFYLQGILRGLTAIFFILVGK